MNAFPLSKVAGGAAFGIFVILTAALAVQKPGLVDLAGQEVAAADIVFPFVLATTIVWFILSKRRVVLRPIYFLFFAYLAAFIIASFFARDPWQAAFKTSTTGYLVCIAVVSIELINTRERLKITVLTFLAASVIPVLAGSAAILLFYISPDSTLIPYLTYHYGSVPVGNYPRLSSTFVSASMFCNFLNVSMMFLLIAFAKEWVRRILFLAGIAAVITCAIFTISSGLGSIFLALGVWIWNWNRRSINGRAALLTGIAVFILSLASGFVAIQPHSTAPYSIKLPLTSSEVHPSPRLLVWTEAAKNFQDNFVVGNGPGSPSAKVIFQNSEGTYSLLTDAHNSFLSIATQTGVIGLISILAITVYLVRIGFGGKYDPLRFGLATAFLTAFVTQGLVGSYEDSRHLWFLIGILYACVNVAEDESATEVGGGP